MVHRSSAQKGVADAQRGQLFTKLAKEIIIAAKQGGADPTANFRLRLAVQKAKENNMPADNIERAIKRGDRRRRGRGREEIMYEGYGPAGTAVIVEAATDNRNRTVAEVRNVFARAGGNLGETGSVAWNFELRGVITVAAERQRPRRGRAVRDRCRRRGRRRSAATRSRSTRSRPTSKP